MDVNQLLSIISQSVGENANASMGIEDKKQALSNENISSMQSAIPSAIGVSQQKMQGEYDAQENAISIRDSLGNVANDPNSLLGIMVQDFRENSIAARNQQVEIAAKQQVGLFDDPFQFLVNQVMLPDEINAYNATQGKADAAANTIQNMQALTTASAQAQKATAQSITKQSMQQAAEVQTVELNAKINALKIDALGYDSNAIKIAQEANSQLASYAMQQHSAQLQDAAAARAAESHKLSVKMHNMQMDKMRESDANDSQYIAIINAGAASYEMPTMDANTIKMMLKSPNQKAKLDRYFDQGLAVAQTGSKAVGATPGESIINTLEIGGLQGQQNRPTRDFLARLSREAADEYQTKNGKITKMTPDIRAGIAALVDDKLFGPMNQKTGKRMETQGLEYKMHTNADAPGSLIKAPDLPQLIQLPAVRANPLYELVLKPAAEAGLTSSSPDQIYSLATAARDKGLINDKQMAMGISDLYKSVSVYTYASRGLGKFGVPYRPSYIAEAPSVFSFDPSSKDRINWANPESVLSYDLAAKSRLAYSSNYKEMLRSQGALTNGARK